MFLLVVLCLALLVLASGLWIGLGGQLSMDGQRMRPHDWPRPGAGHQPCQRCPVVAGPKRVRVALLGVSVIRNRVGVGVR